jgi:methylenetetrahydrofolate reductase (NADPH)
MCQKLLDHGIKGLHFYTLNLEKSVTRIVQGLGLTTRRLPWQNVRDKETIRPIFWVNRPKSYLHRTASWDEFPNGRWGDSRSPAYGDLTDYHLNQLHYNKALNRQKMWGEVITSFEDVKTIFVRYLRGEIPVLPWVDTQLAPETDVIKDKIIQINERGFLTINSQPCINGAPSSDPVNGWGGTGGYVYQKAYVEFFASPEDTKTLINVCQKFPSVTYHAIASNGESYTNTSGTNAITWGVFPGKEIIQPTVCDSHSFTVWKDEAFALWKVWAHLYDADSSSAKIINNIHATYFLINLVDNDFVKGNIFAVFDAIFHLQQQQQAA